MASVQSVELVNAPQDIAVADYLTNDLARRGVAISRDPVPAGPLVLAIGPASATDPGLQAVAERAAQAGRQIHVVRLGEGQYDWPSLRDAASWTDAHGASAQANVAALADRLRAIAPSSPPSPWAAAAAPPPSPWASPAPPPQPSPWPSDSQPAPPRTASEPSDRGSLIALFVIGGLGILLLILYLTGALKLGATTPTAPPTTYGGPATPGPATTGGVTDQWLTGTWKENCASSEFVRFDLAAGTVTFHNGAGRVTRSGNSLTITGGGGSVVMTVAYVGPDQMSATAQGGTQTLLRCG